LKAVALFSGGLDSILAVKLVESQGIEVQGVTFETPFFHARRAVAAASKIELPLQVIDITEEHLAMLRAPRYGYGKYLNPCIDCHAMMLRKAGDLLPRWQADFIITGEVLGQRPMSQTRQSLHVVAKYSGYQDLIVRPLSAKRLPVTRAEQEGLINREGLLDIHGRGRRRQMEAAASLGIGDYVPPAGGCLLTDPMFSKRLKDLFDHGDFDVTAIHLLKTGRHFRIADRVKVIVGRNQGDNLRIEKFAKDPDLLIRMSDYPGPTTLVPGGCDEAEAQIAASLCVLYGDAPDGEPARLTMTRFGTSRTMESLPADRESALPWII
jgi:tRNA U34 2-thiouridine synthase MnmA/TrmU